MNAPKLFIVIPCYNEQEALPITARRLVELTDDMLSKKLIAPESRIVLVDDGSRDDTWKVITGLHAADGRFEGVKLAHNAGHMNALWAGMTLSVERCDCVITIDADLQDDVNAMYGFLEEYGKGADVVYGVRSSREKDTFFKRATAQGFYRMMGKLGVELVYNHADYRLLSKRALEALLSFGQDRRGVLRAGRACGGGEQIPPEEDDRLRGGGHYVAEQPSHPLGAGAGDAVRVAGRDHGGICHRFAGQGEYRSRLGLADDVHMAAGRLAADGPWHDWRVRG